MFLVTDNEQTNLALHAEVCRLLRIPMDTHPHDVVPRLFVRIDDHRYARKWRLEHLADSGDVRADDERKPSVFFSDALSATDATAEAIIEQLLPKVEAVQWRVSALFIVGDDPLALQLVEEVAWQQWCRYEVAAAAYRPFMRLRCAQDHDPAVHMCLGVPAGVAQHWPQGGSLHVYVPSDRANLTSICVERAPTDDDTGALRGLIHRGERFFLHGEDDHVAGTLERLAALVQNEYQASRSLLELAAQPALREVVLAGGNADDRVAEWERLRAPWQLWDEVDVPLRMLRIRSAGSDWEAAAVRVLQTEEAALVVAQDSTEHRASAIRLAERFPADFVMVRDGSTLGLEHPIASGAPYRFGGSLLRQKSAFDASCVPVDSLARLARQQHAVYLRRWPSLPSAAALSQQRLKKVTGQDWPLLPSFFQEDNVRQHRALLQWFARRGYRWVSVTDGAAPAGVVAHNDLADLDEQEYNRWRELRHAQGWVVAARDDRLRQHPELAGFEYIDQSYNHGLLIQILHRMWALGMTVEPMTKMRRIGTVTAIRLTESHTWQTSHGDALSSGVGDWWITDVAGDSRGMSDEAFQEMHVRVGNSDQWVRSGEVFVRKAANREIVETREGTAIASPGMWVVQSMSGEQWPITDAALHRGYEEVPPPSGA
jgi:hypothetical protein